MKSISAAEGKMFLRAGKIDASLVTFTIIKLNNNNNNNNKILQGQLVIRNSPKLVH